MVMNCTLNFIGGIFIGVCLLTHFTSFAQFDKKDKPIVVIDAGHGGNDSGAIGTNGIIEKDVVLKIALEIVRLNDRNKDSDIEYYLTRYSDILISLRDRVLLAKVLQTKLFISIHCNEAKNIKARGIEVYTFNYKGIYSEESILIGYHIEKALASKIGLKSRGVKFANFQVLRESVDYFPAILIELGFISNFDETAYFENPNNLKYLALIIYQTITRLMSK